MGPSAALLVPESFDDGAALLAATRESGAGGSGRQASRLALPPGRAQRRLDQGAAPRHPVVRRRRLGSTARRMPGRMASLLVGTPTGDGLLAYDGAVGSGLHRTPRSDAALREVLAGIEVEAPRFHPSAELPPRRRHLRRADPRGGRDTPRARRSGAAAPAGDRADASGPHGERRARGRRGGPMKRAEHPAPTRSMGVPLR